MGTAAMQNWSHEVCARIMLWIQQNSKSAFNLFQVVFSVRAKVCSTIFDGSTGHNVFDKLRPLENSHALGKRSLGSTFSVKEHLDVVEQAPSRVPGL
jgi:hypothetical protein